MIRKSYFSSITWGVRVAMMLLAFSLYGCMDTYQPEEGRSLGAVLNIRVTPSTEVNFRSGDDLRDSAIDNLYILRFNTEGKFVKAEEVENASAVLANSSITLKEAPNQGETVIAIANTYGVNLSSLIAGTSTVADIATAFPGNMAQDNWRIKTEQITNGTLSVPMSGEVTWTASASHEIELKRSVAQVKLSINIAEGADATGSLLSNDLQDVQWKIINIPDVGQIYRPSGVALTDGYAGGVDYMTLSTNNVAFIPETNNFSNIDTDLKGEQRRPSIIIKYKVKMANGTLGQEKYRYYRMDFNDRHYIPRSGDPAPTLTYRPIQRNSAYTFTITSAKSHGYETENEAINNPPTNIVYKIVIRDNDQSSLTHSGQYFISTSWENMLIFYLPMDKYFDMDRSYPDYSLRSVAAGRANIIGPDDTKDINVSVRAYEVTDALLPDVHKLSTYDRTDLKRIDEDNPDFPSGGDDDTPGPPGPPSPEPGGYSHPLGDAHSVGSSATPSPLQYEYPGDDDGDRPVPKLPKETTRFVWQGYKDDMSIYRSDFVKRSNTPYPLLFQFNYWPNVKGDQKPTDIRAVFKIDAGNARKIMNVAVRNSYITEVGKLPDKEIARIKGLYPPFFWKERPWAGYDDSAMPIEFQIVKVAEPDVYSIRLKTDQYYSPYPMTLVLTAYYKPPTSGKYPGTEHFTEGVTYINFVLPAVPGT